MFKKLTSTTLTPESRLGKDPDFCYMLIKISLLNNVRIHETNVRLLFITLSTANLRAFITFLRLSETFLNHTGGCEAYKVQDCHNRIKGSNPVCETVPKCDCLSFGKDYDCGSMFIKRDSEILTTFNLIHVHGHKFSILNSCWQSNMDNS